MLTTPTILPLYGLPSQFKQKNLDAPSMIFQKSQTSLNKGGVTLWITNLKFPKNWICEERNCSKPCQRPCIYHKLSSSIPTPNKGHNNYIRYNCDKNLQLPEPILDIRKIHFSTWSASLLLTSFLKSFTTIARRLTGEFLFGDFSTKSLNTEMKSI